jgi:serine/threonine protein kinase
MGSVIPFQAEGVVPHLAAAVPPLADVGCCQEIPEHHSHVEPSAEPRLPSGFLLDGRFAIQELVACSGQATVYRALDLPNGWRDVAVKVPLRRVECDAAGFARFQREDETGLRLSHPSLLKFHAVAGGKSRPYLVMEYLRGCTLAHLVRDQLPLAEADALKIVGLVAAAVGHMHRQGLIHRDLKPSNIMLCCDQTLRVVDFGLSSPPLRHRSVLARLGTIFGAPEFMAPEQVENGPIDERTDIYALGCVLYQLLTGTVPFPNENQWQSAFQRTSGDPVAPRKLNPVLSPQAEEIILHALQRRPDDRYPSMAAFEAELGAPDRVVVTGRCERLRPPRFKLSLQGTPMLAGLLLGFGTLLFLVVMFLVLCTLPHHR